MARALRAGYTVSPGNVALDSSWRGNPPIEQRGYNLMFPFLPTDFEAFTRDVVPLLQAKGVFRKEYEPGTLRDRMGLKKPVNSFLL